MPLASSSLVQIAYAPEVTFGVIPTVGNNNKLRITGESLKYGITKESSGEINSSRATSSKVPVSASTSGDIQFEMSYKEYDPLVEAVLQSSYAAFGTNGVGATFTASNITATTIATASATSGASNWANLLPGQFFRLAAPGNANDGKICRVSLVTPPTNVLITVDASTPLVVAAGIANCTVATSRLTHGTTQKSFTVERQHADIGEFWAYTGQVPGKWDFEFGAGQLTKHSMTFEGKKAVRGVATQLPGTATESSAYDIHSSASGIACILWVDGTPLVGTFVTALKFSYDNAIAAQTAACDIGAVGVRSGTIKLTGTMSVYFANGTLFDKFASNTNIAVTFSSLDSVGNGYVFSLPKVNLTDLGGVNAAGKDQDIIMDIEFEALRDLGNANASLRRVVFIDRVGVAV